MVANTPDELRAVAVVATSEIALAPQAQTEIAEAQQSKGFLERMMHAFHDQLVDWQHSFVDSVHEAQATQDRITAERRLPHLAEQNQ